MTQISKKEYGKMYYIIMNIPSEALSKSVLNVQ
jgi:hypothetical protein